MKISNDVYDKIMENIMKNNAVEIKLGKIDNKEQRQPILVIYSRILEVVGLEREE